MKKLSKNLIISALIAFLILPVFSVPALAQDDPFGIQAISDSELVLQDEVNPKEAAINIINLVLTFLGLIALIIILIGGFKWMTAGGNEDKVGEAKKLMISGVVGLVIVLAAWGIASWIIDVIQEEVMTGA